MIGYGFLLSLLYGMPWTSNTASADPVTAKLIPGNEDQGHFLSILITWNDTERDKATVYKATVVDELDVPVCQSGLITTMSFTCKGLHRAGDGLPIPSEKIEKLRVRVEASRLETLRNFMGNGKN